MNRFGKKTQKGFTLLETMVVLAIAIGAYAWSGTSLTTYMDLQVNQAAADYTKKVKAAAAEYIKDNEAALLAAATATTPAQITVPMLKATNKLPASFGLQNSYGQTTVVQVLEPVAGKLESLLLTQGGETIKDIDLRRIAAMLGQQGGYVLSSAPTVATGLREGWGPVATSAYGLSPGAGHIALALFYGDNNTTVGDYVYRNAVPGRPELNTMTTPLIMSSTQTLNSACTQQSAIATDNTGAVLSCQGPVGAMTWQQQGSAYWKDPVASAAALPTCNAATRWQTRIVQTPTVGTGPRAYTCAASGWAALAVDDNGNITIPGRATVNGGVTVAGTSTFSGNTTFEENVTLGNATDDVVKLGVVVAEGAACAGGNGAMGRTSAGLILSCQSGVWRRTETTYRYGGTFIYDYDYGSCLTANSFIGACGCPPGFTNRLAANLGWTSSRQIWSYICEPY